MTRPCPAPLAPLLRTSTLALLDEPLLRAFRYPPPRPLTRALDEPGTRPVPGVRGCPVRHTGS
nr:hypothetical protein [Kutzneria buriramensis]WKX14849.1 hypothetical protein Q4V64_48095 [Kutzneria buriramensis]